MDLISKYDLIEKIVKTDNEFILQQVKMLLDEDEGESWNDLDPELKVFLEEGIAQADRGEVTRHEDVIKAIRKKYPK